VIKDISCSCKLDEAVMLPTGSRLFPEPLLILSTAAATHLVMSFAQTVMHYKLGHHPMDLGKELGRPASHQPTPLPRLNRATARPQSIQNPSREFHRIRIAGPKRSYLRPHDSRRIQDPQEGNSRLLAGRRR
jgi:hypothetical protein